MDVSKLKVAEIKKELKDRGLNITGNKQELVARLQEAIEAEVIGQDDDVVDDLNGVEGVEVGAKEEEEVLEPKEKPEEKPVRKIVLNRRIEFPSDTETPKEEEKTDANSDTKKATTITLTPAERLALRAKRFGSTLQEAATPAAVTTETTPTATTPEAPAAKKAKVEPPSAEQLEVLRKRAERFGTSVSPTVESADSADKKKLRQDRFSTLTPSTPATEAVVAAAPLDGPAVAPTSDIKIMTAEDRKKMRAERFK